MFSIPINILLRVKIPNIKTNLPIKLQFNDFKDVLKMQRALVVVMTHIFHVCLFYSMKTNVLERITVIEQLQNNHLQSNFQQFILIYLEFNRVASVCART